MIIDVHCHYQAKPGYMDNVLRVMDENKIDMSCLSPLPPQFEQPGAEAVLAECRKHPDRLIPFGYIQLGMDDAKRVYELHDMGCRGIKMHIPFKPYSDESYFPIYAACEELKLPILFHTGFIVTRTKLDPKYHVNSANMRPEYLDVVARTFQNLNMIAAHIGIPWHREAAMTSCYNPNVFVDLACDRVDGPQCYCPAFFRDLFNWKDAFRKVVFGGSHYGHAGWLLQHNYLDTFKALRIDQETQDLVLSGNMKMMLGMK